MNLLDKENNKKPEDIALERISDKEYFAINALSSTSLNTFIKQGPEAFWFKHLSGLYEKEELDFFEYGTGVHTKILLPEEYKETYFTFKGDKPYSSNEHAFCKLVAEGNDVIEAYKNTYSIKGKKLQTIEKEANERYNKLCDYINKVLVNDNGYKFIPEEWAILYDESAYEYLQHPEVIEELEMIEKDNCAVYNEYYFQTSIAVEEDLYLDVKIKPDKVIINDVTKTIYIDDLKTSKYASFEEFKQTVPKYGYDVQAAFYQKILKKALPEKYKDYSIVTRIIVFSKESPITVTFITLSNEFMLEATRKTNEALKSIAKYYNKGTNRNSWKNYQNNKYVL